MIEIGPPLIKTNFNILALSYLFPNRAQPGYGIFVHNRLKAIQKFCNIRVIAPIQWYPRVHRFRGRLWGSDIPLRDQIGGLEVHHPRFFTIPRYMKWLDGITYLLAVRSVVKQLNENGSFDFDLIDLHWTYPDIVAGSYLAKKFRKRYIVTVRGHEALYLDENTLRRRILAHFLRRADFVIALSDELLRVILALGVDPNKIRVVLNGVDLSLFKLLDREACRRQIGLPLNKKIILSIGRMTKGKGHQELIRMMPDILKLHDVELYIIGGVNPEDDFSHVLRSLIRNFGLNDKVHFIEKVNHEMLPIWYNAADIFCMATKREGCPNVVLEALACGTPSVVTDVGATREYIKNGKNGFLVPPDKICCLSGIVNNVLSTHWDRHEIAKGMAIWGWPVCAENVFEIYRSVLSRLVSN